MPPGDGSRVEAPVTTRAYLLCAFAAFGGIMYGYDSGYINGVLGMPYFKQEFGEPVSKDLDSTGYHVAVWEKSLIVSILSAGTFAGALCGGIIADWIGRRISIITACGVFCIGVALQVAASVSPMLMGGRLVAGFGVGLVSSIVIMYMSEIAPKAIRGAIVAGYQWAITIGLLIAACINQATHARMDASAYRIPISIQFVWALILAVGLFFLPESPRWYVKEGRHEDALASLAILRDQPPGSNYLKEELEEIVANFEYEMSIAKATWLDCFKDLSRSGNARRVLIGTCLQMFQQLTGVNFIFYYGTTFFESSGIENPFLISLITNLVNVIATPASFYGVERFGRRKLLLWGAILMLVSEYIIGGVGTALEGSKIASMVLIVFVCIYIAGFATSWGPTAWIIVGEIYPLPIRAKGVALATASNWFWNFAIGYSTPYMVDPAEGNMKAKVFFVWGTCCTLCFLFAYFFVPETKGLSLEQVDRMMEETTPRQSAKWVPHAAMNDNRDKEKA